ncbi:MAG: dockerin type I domain-containing protein, partial [Planctomycetota bacterium]
MQPLDVTRDGNVSALDALRVINALNRSEDGSVDPADSLGSFVDVTGDGRGTALDALRVINALNREAPLIAATLPNDSGPAERTDLALDLLTNNYNIDLNVSVGELADNKVRIRIGKDNAFADITDQFTEGSANLTPTEIDDYFGNPLPDGDHEITVQIGEDGDAINFVLTLDRQTPVPQLTSGPLLRISPNQLVVTFGESVLGEDVTSEDFRLQQLGAEAITIASTEVLTDRIRLALPAHLPDAGFELTYTGSLTDLAGNVVTQGVVNAFTVADPTGVVEISPANGEELVNVKRETIVRFDEPVDPATVTDASFYVIANGERVPGNIRVSRTELFATLFYEDPLPASTEVRVILDGGQIIGRDGLSLDGDGDDEPGGVITADFRTLPLTQISGTELFGFVKDSQTREPLAGVRISLEAFPQIFAVTDEAGFFEIGTQDLDGDGQGDGLPAPEFFAHIDGSTVTNQGGKVYASLGKPFPTVPGQREQLRKNGEIFDIFLPSISPDAIKTLTAGQDTQVGFGASDRQMLAGMFPDIDPAMFEVMRVTIVDEAAQNDQGEPATEAFVVPVDPDFLPAPLPPNLNPELVISVQTPGATNFDTPAAVSFPNLEGNVPGQKVLLFSFDHDKGEFVVNGTATVSEDGMSIASDPGVGIQAPGWHFVQSGTETDGKPGD